MGRNEVSAGDDFLITSSASEEKVPPTIRRGSVYLEVEARLDELAEEDPGQYQRDLVINFLTGERLRVCQVKPMAQK